MPVSCTNIKERMDTRLLVTLILLNIFQLYLLGVFGDEMGGIFSSGLGGKFSTNGNGWFLKEQKLKKSQ